LQALLRGYPEWTQLVWVQEEPRNMGAWTFLRLLAGKDFWGGRRVRCVAREESATPATGSASWHEREQQALVEHALS
jgi:2-oxoglutarate dehydrogenase E1 component